MSYSWSTSKQNETMDNMQHLVFTPTSEDYFCTVSNPVSTNSSSVTWTSPCKWGDEEEADEEGLISKDKVPIIVLLVLVVILLVLLVISNVIHCLSKRRGRQHMPVLMPDEQDS